jgi:hypothetical protein
MKARTAPLEYFTLDPRKAAYFDGVKVLGDVFQSLPSSLLLMVAGAATRGAAIAARTKALLEGATLTEARDLAIAAAVKAGTAIAGIGEGLVAYGQQSTSVASKIEKMAFDRIAKSPEFQEYIALGYDPEVAKTLTAGRAGEASGLMSLVTTGAIAGVGGRFLGKIIGEGGALLPRALKGGAIEGGVEAPQSGFEQFEENVATKIYANPAQSLTENVAEATAQGAILGPVVGGPMAGAFGSNVSKADQAQQDRATLEAIVSASADNAILSRSPQAFQNFIDLMTEEGKMAEVYVDTETLGEIFRQTGVNGEELAKTMPDVFAQMNDPLNEGGSIRITTGDLIANVRTPEVLDSILNNSRITPEGMTFIESEVFFQTFKEHAAVAEAKQDSRKQREIELRDIRNEIADQLVATGRYDKFTARANAIPLSEFYAVQSQRFGMSPAEMFAQYPYQAQAGTTAQTEGFDQADRTQAKVGGETAGSNGYFYKGGQFLPSTKAEPGKWKVGKKWIVSGKELVAPGVFENQPTPFSRSLFSMIQGFAVTGDSGKLELNPRLTQVNGDTLIRPGVKGVLGKEELSLQEMFDAYNNGQRWFDVNPDAEITTSNILKQGDLLGGYDPSGMMTTFFEGANLSTVIHESGHFYLDVMGKLAARPDAPQTVINDFNAIMDWFGVTAEQWNSMSVAEQTPHHEQFAESFELWMLEGKAPTLKMQPVFVRFKNWMLRVYQSAEAFLRSHPAAGNLNDEVRAVFSRLIASEEAVAEAEAARGYVPIFQTAEQAGMTEAEYAEYLRLDEAATQEAVDTVQRRAMRDMKWLSNARSKVLKRIQAEAKALRDVIRAEVTQEVMNEPINLARHFLRTGEMIDAATGTVTRADNFKLNTAAMKELSPDGKIPPYMKHLVSPDGVHPNLVASMFDFDSAEQLFFNLVTAEDAQTKIDGLTDARMLERHGEMVDAQAIEETVNAAIVNEARTRFLATGLSILLNGSVPASQLAKAAKIAAQDAIAKVKVQDLRPKQYEAAESRANKEALKYAASDPARAIRAQRTAIINNALYKEAIAVQEEVENDIVRMKAMSRPSAQKAMGGEHLIQLNALLERFGVKSRQTSQTAVAPRRDLGTYIQATADQNAAIAPTVAPWIVSEQISQDYNTLSITEFRELMDAVKSIGILARRERDQYIKIRDQTFAEDKATVLQRLRQFHGKLFNPNGSIKKETYQSTSQKSGLSRLAGEFGALLMNAEAIVHALEGGEFGALHEMLLGRMSERTEWKATRMEGLLKKIKELYKPYNRLDRRAFSRANIVPTTLKDANGAPIVLTREEVTVIALLHGNVEGRQRMEAAYGWNEDKQREIIDLLDARDVKLVNGIWEIFDKDIWPELAALDERTRGKAAPKVEAMPYQTKNGGMTGGYFKLKYDSERGAAATGAGAIDQMLGGDAGGMAPRTAQGASIARVETSNKPPKLTMNIFADTVSETVHDIAFREAVADTYRLLKDEDIQTVIKRASSEKEYRALVGRIESIATRAHQPNSPFERFFNQARKNTVTVLLSGFYTALQNVLNLAPLAARVGVANTALEAMRMTSVLGPAAYRFAVESSHYLRNRHLSYDRALQEESKKLTINEPLMPAMSTWLWLMGKTDQLMSAIAWNAAYKKGMRDYANNHDKAVLFADHVVRQTQGSGRELDISQMQEGPYRQLLTMFYSFAGSQLNLQIRAGVIAKRNWNEGEKLKAIMVFMKTLAMVVILPAILNDLALSLMRGDPGEEEPEDWVKRFGRDAMLYQMSFIPVLREIGPYVWRSFDDDLASFGYKMSPVVSAVEGARLGVKSGIDLYKDEGDEKSVGNAIMGVSYLLGLPGTPIKNAVVGTGAFMDDTGGPQGILFGPPKERK